MQRRSGASSGSGPPSIPSPWAVDTGESGSGRRRQMLDVAHICITLALFALCLFLYRDLLRARTASDVELGAVSPNLEGKFVGNSFIVPSNPLEKLQVRLTRTVEELEASRRLVRHMERDLRKCQAEIEDEGDSSTSAKLTRLEKRDRALLKRLERAEDSIQRLSRELLKHKFPDKKEPFLLNLRVGFPESMGSPKEEDITIELAKSNIMPTAVLYFLSQVEAGLWNGCSFIRNANHVLQADPQDVSKKGLHSRFKRLAFQGVSIPFQEFSSSFPHEKYTIGLAGRPGGPDFYISTVNNVKNHGPGGQSSYDLPEEADSCFGKVVKGFHVVDRMHKAPRKGDGFQGLIEFIEIIEIRIL